MASDHPAVVQSDRGEIPEQISDYNNTSTQEYKRRVQMQRESK